MSDTTDTTTEPGESLVGSTPPDRSAPQWPVDATPDAPSLDDAEIQQRFGTFTMDYANEEGQPLAVETIISGKHVGTDPLDRPRACLHRQYLQEVVIARVQDEAGAVEGMRAQVRVKCAECGEQVRFTGQSIFSDDGQTAGIYFEVG